MVRFREITMAQPIEMTTLISATMLIAASDAGRILPNPVEIGAAQVGYGRLPVADLNPRIKKMQIPMDRITDSTK